MIKISGEYRACGRYIADTIYHNHPIDFAPTRIIEIVNSQCAYSSLQQSCSNQISRTRVLLTQFLVSSLQLAVAQALHLAPAAAAASTAARVHHPLPRAWPPKGDNLHTEDRPSAWPSPDRIQLGYEIEGMGIGEGIYIRSFSEIKARKKLCLGGYKSGKKFAQAVERNRLSNRQSSLIN